MPLPERRTFQPPKNLEPKDLILFEKHIEGGRFFNPWGRTVKPSPLDMVKWKLGANPYAKAKRDETPLVPVQGGLDKMAGLSGCGVLWIGHASFLIELDGLRILVDPIFGPAGRVVPRVTPAPFEIADLPPIDVVLITHGHYDHLDRTALEQLGQRFGDRVTVVVPLGLASAVPRSCSRVVEVDWWTVIHLGGEVGGIEAIFVPAQHWHQRGVADFNRALWGGYVLRGSKTLYHSGDSGYFGGFRTLGRIFEGIDLAMMPIGAYEPRWFMHPQHMGPDEALQAFDELGAGTFLGMHWGTYDLTDEPLGEGARELMRLIEESGRPADRFLAPLPGTCVEI